MRRLLVISTAACVLFGAYLLLQVPIGVPGEWTWTYADGPPWVGLLQVLPFLIAFLAAIRYGIVQADSLRGKHAGGWLTVTVLTFFAFSLSTVYLWQFDRYEIYYLMNAPAVNGTFLDEARRLEDVPAYLNDYQKRMSEPESKHRSTHLMSNPPGFTLLLHAILRPLRSRRNVAMHLGTVLEPRNAWQEQRHSMGEEKREKWFLITTEVMLTFLVIVLLTSLSLLPIYGLCRHLCGPRSAAMVTGLVMLLPNFHVFSPYKNSLEILFIGMIWYASLRAAGADSIVWSLLAGIAVYLGTFVSLICLPATLFVALVGGLSCLASDSPSAWWQKHGQRITTAVKWACLGFSFPALLLWLSAGYNPVLVTLQGVSGQHTFFAEYGRTYSSWVFVNLWEWLLFGGGVFAGIFLIALKCQVQQWLARGRRGVDPYLAGVLITLLALDVCRMPLSETGRHWLFLSVGGMIAACRVFGLEEKVQVRSGLWLAGLMSLQTILYILLLDVWEASMRVGSGLLFG